MSEKPTRESVKEVVRAVKSYADYAYFLGALRSPSWIRPLAEEGFFQSPPEPEAAGEGLVRYPAWPASRYLARMASQAPEEVMALIVKIETENARVRGDLIEAAIAMPPRTAKGLVPRVTKWLHTPHQLLVPHLSAKLLAHLVQGREGPDAIRLVRALLAMRDETGSEASARQDPRPWIEESEYRQILTAQIPGLASIEPRETFTLLCGLLEHAVRSSLSGERAKDGPEDYSYIWRPAIEQHEQNRDHSFLRADLAIAVRDCAVRILSEHTDALAWVLEELERRPFHVFRRIAIHLARVHPSVPRDVGDRFVLDERLFAAVTLRHEYVLLLQERFQTIVEEERGRILGWIEAEPELERYRARYEELEGRAPSDEEVEGYRRRTILKRLQPLKDLLPPVWRRRYDEWSADHGEPEHPEFPGWSSGVWVGPTSPKSKEELGSMTVGEIVSYIKHWEPPSERFDDSAEGLGRVLTEVVAEDPGRFARQATEFMATDPTYVRGLLAGWREAIREKRTFPWETISELCAWVVEQPRDVVERKDRDYEDLDPGWEWTRKEIANLLSAGFDSQEAGLPFELREQAWNVLEELTRDSDPTPDHEREYGGSNMDPLTLSLNTTRGQAMHAVFGYALWVKRCLGRTGDESVLGEIPEVKKVLEEHLDVSRDPSLAVRAVYGRWFPWMVLLDREWAGRLADGVFPDGEGKEPYWGAAWDAYIVFDRAYENVFDVLQDKYGRAIARIGRSDRQARYFEHPDKRLGEHLMQMYGRGEILLDEREGLVAEFFRAADDELRRDVLGFVGSTTGGLEGSSPIIERFKRLWDWRLRAAQEAGDARTSKELMAIGEWFTSGSYGDDWSLEQLRTVLRLSGGVEHAYATIERLAETAKTFPDRTVECARLILEGRRDEWSISASKEKLRELIEAALASGDEAARRAAVDLIHRLGAAGYYEFRDLLPGERK